jgi:hypothetical protein
LNSPGPARLASDMFLLDSLMISGIRWALETVVTAAETEMNDDTVLREQLLEAEMRRELGEIDADAFRAIESDLLARIRTIRERREGGSGPLTIADAGPLERAAGERFSVDASLTGDFHQSGDAAPAAGVTRPPAPEPIARRAPRRRNASPARRRRS